MPTTRKRRSRQLRRLPGGAIERFIHGEIDADELCVELHNRFAMFGVTDKGHPHGQEAYEIWQRDGAALLAEHNFRGFKCYPGTNIIDDGDLPPNLLEMVSSFGEPWK